MILSRFALLKNNPVFVCMHHSRYNRYTWHENDLAEVTIILTPPMYYILLSEYSSICTYDKSHTYINDLRWT